MDAAPAEGAEKGGPGLQSRGVDKQNQTESGNEFGDSELRVERADGNATEQHSRGPQGKSEYANAANEIADADNEKKDQQRLAGKKLNEWLHAHKIPRSDS
jgi:hypothetical protein